MRKTVIRLSRVLLTLAGIGLLSVIIAILYFSGVASSVESGVWSRNILGFDYGILTAFGFFLLSIGVFPVLMVLDANAKKSIKKIYVHLLFLVGLGIIFLLYSSLVYGTFLEPLDPLQTWLDYFVIAALLIIFGLSPILASVRDYERLWNFKILFALFIIVGLLLQPLSIVVYSQTIDLLDIGWDMFFLIGLLMLYLGIAPLLLSASQGFRELLYRLRILWILGALVGIILFAVSTLVYGEIIPKSTLLDTDWFVFLAFGSLVIIVTVLPLVSTKELHDILFRLRFVWLVSFVLGILLILISAVLVLPTSPDFSDITTIDNIIGVTWDVFFIYGAIITSISLIFICSVLYFESEELGVSEELFESVDRLPGIETTSTEMIAYLEILSKSHHEMLNQFKEAVREDKFRPKVYEALVKQYRDRNRTIMSRISVFKKESPVGTVSEDMDIFDAAISDEPLAPEPSVPSAPPVPGDVAAPPPAPPTPPPSAPPSAPPSPPSPPPSVPSPPTPMPPAPSVPSALPSMPPAPAAMPPAPTAPSQPGESPLDLIADARSTSIAELRGEMLKELRRLREIFKED